MSRPIIYTTSWCGPCNELKQWITAQGYSVDYRDGDKETCAAWYNNSISLIGRR